MTLHEIMLNFNHNKRNINKNYIAANFHLLHQQKLSITTQNIGEALEKWIPSYIVMKMQTDATLMEEILIISNQTMYILIFETVIPLLENLH